MTTTGATVLSRSRSQKADRKKLPSPADVNADASRLGNLGFSIEEYRQTNLSQKQHQSLPKYSANPS